MSTWPVSSSQWPWLCGTRLHRHTAASGDTWRRCWWGCRSTDTASGSAPGTSPSSPPTPSCPTTSSGRRCCGCWTCRQAATRWTLAPMMVCVCGDSGVTHNGCCYLFHSSGDTSFNLAVATGRGTVVAFEMGPPVELLRYNILWGTIYPVAWSEIT